MESKNLQKYFDNRFQVKKISKKKLPFFHSCDAYHLRNILESRKLKITKCSVFNEMLLYLFYGRPAYKTIDSSSSGLNSLLPTILILKNDQIDTIQKIAPFDTGAFENGLYKSYMHTSMKVDDFFMTPNNDSILKTIAFFFKTNSAYFDGNPLSKITYDSCDFEVESYYRLINSVEIQSADDRKASIEIQLNQDIILTEQIVEAVVFPEELKSSKLIREVVIEEFKAVPITYRSGMIPSQQYYGLVLHLVRQYLKKKKHFNEYSTII